MRPAVEMVLELNLKVEMWGWGNDMSPVYEGMSRTSSNLHIFDLRYSMLPVHT